MIGLRKNYTTIKCVRCAKLISAENGGDTCSACLGNVDTPQIDPPPAVKAMGAGETPCIQCGQAPALENADRCLECQWDLFNGMNGAMEGLRSRVQKEKGSLQGRTQHLLETLAQKRSRAATNRIDFVAIRRVR